MSGVHVALAPEEPSNLGQEARILGWRRDHEKGIVEFLGEGEDVGISVCGLPGEPPHDDGFHLRAEIEIRASLVYGDGWLGQKLGEHLPGALRQIRMGPGEEEVGNGRERVLVRGGGHELARKCLGGHVHEGADEVPCPGKALVLSGVRCGCDPEIQELGGAGNGIVHGVVGFQIPVNNAGVMSRLDGLADAQDDPSNFRTRKRGVLLGISLEELSRCPLDDEVVKAVRHPCLDGANDVGVNDSLPELGFAVESSDRGLLQSQLVTEHLEGYLAVGGMLCAVDNRSAALAYEGLERVAGDGSPDKILFGHGAEPNGRREGQQAISGIWPGTYLPLLTRGMIHPAAGPGTMHRRRMRQVTISLVALLTLSACASGGGTRTAPQGPGATPPGAAVSTRRIPVQPDVVALYRRLGLLAEGGETPFVGSLSFLAGATPDSSVVVLTVSLANRALKFAREGDQYRASYNVGLEVKRGEDVVRDVNSKESVRVLAFRETQRSDESVLFRQIVTLAPGMYDIRLVVRDDSASRGSAIEATVGVPRFVDGSVSSPVPIYEAAPRESLDSLPRFVATPRATVVFGRDTILPVYVEGYGSAGAFPLRMSVRAEGAAGTLWSDSISLPRRGNLFAGVFNVPIARLGVGVMTIGISHLGSADTLRAPLFVAFGEDLPVATFNEMLDYLRYFVSMSRLNAMRNAAPDARAALWAAFLRETDPVPQTPQNEGLRDYFARIAQANARFREEGAAGWLTDRGRAFVALGPPDQIIEPNLADLNQRGRSQVWEYRQHRLQIVFIDQTGFGRWRMTMSSETEFESVVRRVLPQ